MKENDSQTIQHDETLREPWEKDLENLRIVFEDFAQFSLNLEESCKIRRSFLALFFSCQYDYQYSQRLAADANEEFSMMDKAISETQTWFESLTYEKKFSVARLSTQTQRIVSDWYENREDAIFKLKLSDIETILTERRARLPDDRLLSAFNTWKSSFDRKRNERDVTMRQEMSAAYTAWSTAGKTKQATKERDNKIQRIEKAAQASVTQAEKDYERFRSEGFEEREMPHILEVIVGRLKSSEPDNAKLSQLKDQQVSQLLLTEQNISDIKKYMQSVIDRDALALLQVAEKNERTFTPEAEYLLTTIQHLPEGKAIVERRNQIPRVDLNTSSNLLREVKRQRNQIIFRLQNAINRVIRWFPKDELVLSKFDDFKEMRIDRPVREQTPQEVIENANKLRAHIEELNAFLLEHQDQMQKFKTMKDAFSTSQEVETIPSSEDNFGLQEQRNKNSRYVAELVFDAFEALTEKVNRFLEKNRGPVEVPNFEDVHSLHGTVAIGLLSNIQNDLIKTKESLVAEEQRLSRMTREERSDYWDRIARDAISEKTKESYSYSADMKEEVFRKAKENRKEELRKDETKNLKEQARDIYYLEHEESNSLEMGNFVRQYLRDNESLIELTVNARMESDDERARLKKSVTSSINVFEDSLWTQYHASFVSQMRPYQSVANQARDKLALLDRWAMAGISLPFSQEGQQSIIRQSSRREKKKVSQKLKETAERIQSMTKELEELKDQYTSNPEVLDFFSQAQTELAKLNNEVNTLQKNISEDWETYNADKRFDAARSAEGLDSKLKQGIIQQADNIIANIPGAVAAALTTMGVTNPSIAATPTDVGEERKIKIEKQLDEVANRVVSMSMELETCKEQYASIASELAYAEAEKALAILEDNVTDLKNEILENWKTWDDYERDEVAEDADKLGDRLNEGVLQRTTNIIANISGSIPVPTTIVTQPDVIPTQSDAARERQTVFDQQVTSNTSSLLSQTNQRQITESAEENQQTKILKQLSEITIRIDSMAEDLEELENQYTSDERVLDIFNQAKKALKTLKDDVESLEEEIIQNWNMWDENERFETAEDAEKYSDRLHEGVLQQAANIIKNIPGSIPATTTAVDDPSGVATESDAAGEHRTDFDELLDRLRATQTLLRNQPTYIVDGEKKKAAEVEKLQTLHDDLFDRTSDSFHDVERQVVESELNGYRFILRNQLAGLDKKMFAKLPNAGKLTEQIALSGFHQNLEKSLKTISDLLNKSSEESFLSEASNLITALRSKEDSNAQQMTFFRLHGLLVSSRIAVALTQELVEQIRKINSKDQLLSGAMKTVAQRLNQHESALAKLPNEAMASAPWEQGDPRVDERNGWLNSKKQSIDTELNGDNTRLSGFIHAQRKKAEGEHNGLAQEIDKLRKNFSALNTELQNSETHFLTSIDLLAQNLSDFQQGFSSSSDLTQIIKELSKWSLRVDSLEGRLSEYRNFFSQLRMQSQLLRKVASLFDSVKSQQSGVQSLSQLNPLETKASLASQLTNLESVQRDLIEIQNLPLENRATLRAQRLIDIDKKVNDQERIINSRNPELTHLRTQDDLLVRVLACSAEIGSWQKLCTQLQGFIKDPSSSEMVDLTNLTADLNKLQEELDDIQKKLETPLPKKALFDNLGLTSTQVDFWVAKRNAIESRLVQLRSSVIKASLESKLKITERETTRLANFTHLTSTRNNERQILLDALITHQEAINAALMDINSASTPRLQVRALISAQKVSAKNEDLLDASKNLAVSITEDVSKANLKLMTNAIEPAILYDPKEISWLDNYEGILSALDSDKKTEKAPSKALSSSLPSAADPITPAAQNIVSVQDRGEGTSNQHTRRAVELAPSSQPPTEEKKAKTKQRWYRHILLASSSHSEKGKQKMLDPDAIGATQDLPSKEKQKYFFRTIVGKFLPSRDNANAIATASLDLAGTNQIPPPALTNKAIERYRQLPPGVDAPSPTIYRATKTTNLPGRLLDFDNNYILLATTNDRPERPIEAIQRGAVKLTHEQLDQQMRRPGDVTIRVYPLSLSQTSVPKHSSSKKSGHR